MSNVKRGCTISESGKLSKDCKTLIKIKRPKQVSIFLNEDIAGTYFISGSHFTGIPAWKPYTYRELKFKHSIPENNLPLQKIKRKIKHQGTKLGFKPRFVITRFQ